MSALKAKWINGVESAGEAGGRSLWGGDIWADTLNDKNEACKEHFR